MKKLKILAIALCIVMIISIIPMSVIAADTSSTKYSTRTVVDYDFSKISSLDEIPDYYIHKSTNAEPAVVIKDGALKVTDTVGDKNARICLFDWKDCIKTETDYQIEVTFKLDVRRTSNKTARGGICFNLDNDENHYTYAALYDDGAHDCMTYINNTHSNDYKIQIEGAAGTSASGTKYAATETITAGELYTMSIRIDSTDTISYEIRNSEGEIISDSALVGDLANMKYPGIGSGIGVYARNTTVSFTRFTVTQFYEVPEDSDGKNEPALYGAQMRENDNGTYDIRFVSTIDSVDNYDEVGYVVNLETWTGTATDKNDIAGKGQLSFKSNFAYLAINYTDARGKAQQLQAPDGKYFVAISIAGISLTDKTDYLSGTITPYAVDKNGNKLYGTTYTVTVVDGRTCTFTAVEG